MKLETLLRKLKKDEKYHLSRLKIKEINSKENTSKFLLLKPYGFWYSYYNYWIKLIHKYEKYMRHSLCCYVYKIDINIDNYSNNILDKNKNKILVIDTIRNLNRFIKKYGKLEGYIVTNKDFLIKFIDWEQVSKDFDGIEFNPYLRKEIYKYLDKKIKELKKKKKSIISIHNKFIEKYYWYFKVDMSSGCIWNKTQIKTFKLIAKQDKKTKQWKWIK